MGVEVGAGLAPRLPPQDRARQRPSVHFRPGLPPRSQHPSATEGLRHAPQLGRHSPRTRRAGPGQGRAQARGRAHRACAQGDPRRAAPAAHLRRARHHRPSRSAANHSGMNTRLIPEKDNPVVP